ncbi:MAG: hypothetical protein ABI900_10920 [Betaproteobacteria bacterium]
MALALLAGYETMPEGPTVTALQGADKGYDESRTDDVGCRQYAHAQVGGVMSASADHANGVTSTAPGLAICAPVGLRLFLSRVDDLIARVSQKAQFTSSFAAGG